MTIKKVFFLCLFTILIGCSPDKTSTQRQINFLLDVWNDMPYIPDSEQKLYQKFIVRGNTKSTQSTLTTSIVSMTSAKEICEIFKSHYSMSNTKFKFTEASHATCEKALVYNKGHKATETNKYIFNIRLRPQDKKYFLSGQIIIADRTYKPWNSQVEYSVSYYSNRELLSKCIPKRPDENLCPFTSWGEELPIPKEYERTHVSPYV